MYAKLGRMDIVYELFDRMFVRSYIFWNILIFGFFYNYDCDGVLEMFKRMELEGWEFNIVIWISLLSSYVRCVCYEEVLKLFVLVSRRGISVNVEVFFVVLLVCVYVIVVVEGKMVYGYVIKGGFEGYLIVKNVFICMYGKNGDLKGV